MHLEDALNAIVVAAPAYRWGSSDGALNLIPAGGVPRFLLTRVPRFQHRGTPYDLLDIATGLPEVRAEAAKEKLVRVISGDQLYTITRSRQVALTLANVDLVDVFNAISQQAGGWVWAYSETHCRGRNIYHISFVTTR